MRLTNVHYANIHSRALSCMRTIDRTKAIKQVLFEGHVEKGKCYTRMCKSSRNIWSTMAIFYHTDSVSVTVFAIFSLKSKLV